MINNDSERPNMCSIWLETPFGDDAVHRRVARCLRRLWLDLSRLD